MLCSIAEERKGDKPFRGLTVFLFPSCCVVVLALFRLSDDAFALSCALREGKETSPFYAKGSKAVALGGPVTDSTSWHLLRNPDAGSRQARRRLDAGFARARLAAAARGRSK